MADIISRLLCTKVPKDRVSLFNDCSRKAIVLHDYMRDAEDLILSTVSGIEKSISILKCRVV